MMKPAPIKWNSNGYIIDQGTFHDFIIIYMMFFIEINRQIELVRLASMRDIYSETEVYHTLDIVGKGTFGKVAKCWRGSDGELVAVKSMKIDPHKNRVIKNELKLIGALSRSTIANCNIVQFYEAFRDESHHYLVFELLEMNLYQFQKENGFRPMAVRYIRTITCQMLKALAKLKEIAIIHADLKPENVMIVNHCRYPYYVKLIDFGSASIYNEVRFVKEDRKSVV